MNSDGMLGMRLFPDYAPEPDDHTPLPQDYARALHDHIHGQDEAVRVASVIAWNHQHGRRQTALFMGPTGCGKTEIWRQLSARIDNVTIVDGSQLTANGFRGLHIRDIFQACHSRADSERLLLVVDEADKLMEPLTNSDGCDYSRALQNEFLKICDGDTVTYSAESNRYSTAFTVNCKRVSVVFLGAFEGMLEKMDKARKSGQKTIGFGSNPTLEPVSHTDITIDDLIGYGNVRREIAGRIQTITVMHGMTATDYRAILDAPTMSPISILAQEYGKQIIVDERLKDDLCATAAEQKLGVRYVTNQLRQHVNRALYDDPLAGTLIIGNP